MCVSIICVVWCFLVLDAALYFGTSKYSEIKMAICRNYRHWLHSNFNAVNYQDLNTITTRYFHYMAASYHSPVLIMTFDISLIASNENMLHRCSENNLCRTIRICYVPTSYKFHYNVIIMDTMASEITSLPIVYSTIYSGADQRKHQSSASLAFVWGSHRGPVNSPHKWPVTRKMFPFDDVIMLNIRLIHYPVHETVTI